MTVNRFVLSTMILLSTIGSATSATLQKATFAGGGFWCIEQSFDALDGVKSTTNGFIGGDLTRPNYYLVSQGKSGHREAVEVVFDAEVISYPSLLDYFWRNIDPTDDEGQFCDRGPQYRSGIFTHSPEQKKLARISKENLISSRQLAVTTEILDATQFTAAESYHQDYHRRNPLRHRFYHDSCGRDKRLQQLWGSQ